MPHKAWTLVGRAQRRVSMTRPDYEDVSAKLMLGNRKSWPRSCLLQPKFWQLFHSIGRVDAGNTTDVRFGSKADICSAKAHVRFTPKSGHVRCTSQCPLSANSGHSARRTLCQTDEKQRGHLGDGAASKRDKGGDRGDGAGTLVLQTETQFYLLRNTVSKLIKSGLFFGETTFYEAFLFSSQKSLQNFSVSFDVCLVREQ